MDRTALRRSLAAPTKPRLSVHFNAPSDRGESDASTAEPSDGEWEELRARAALGSELTSHEDSALLQSLYDDPSCCIESLPIVDNAQEVIEQKEREIAQLTAQAIDIQARFVWDLSFAIKQMFFAENFRNPKKAEAISRIGVRDIVQRLESDPCYPEDWIPWIQEPFQLPMAA
jgi:hypothetical protein